MTFCGWGGVVESTGYSGGDAFGAVKNRLPHRKRVSARNSEFSTAVDLFLGRSSMDAWRLMDRNWSFLRCFINLGLGVKAD